MKATMYVFVIIAIIVAILTFAIHPKDQRPTALASQAASAAALTEVR
ncbi:hypothetical protein GCM10025857_09040 [Alicyclobacillus contaminans]|nr:hypothetical protein [Alicyclobacillus contaminans]GMA49547.1 hypothetical protein GCM10025857_09040 [Alicyclobacillus contaminans]